MEELKQRVAKLQHVFFAKPKCYIPKVAKITTKKTWALGPSSAQPSFHKSSALGPSLLVASSKSGPSSSTPFTAPERDSTAKCTWKPEKVTLCWSFLELKKNGRVPWFPPCLGNTFQETQRRFDPSRPVCRDFSPLAVSQVGTVSHMVKA